MEWIRTGAVWRTTAAWDLADAVCHEGYGPDAEKCAIRCRTVIFVKECAGCGLPEHVGPFVLVVERLEPDGADAGAEHGYEILWHLAPVSWRSTGSR